jgi:hypothetical protein
MAGAFVFCLQCQQKAQGAALVVEHLSVAPREIFNFFFLWSVCNRSALNSCSQWLLLRAWDDMYLEKLSNSGTRT